MGHLGPKNTLTILHAADGYSPEQLYDLRAKLSDRGPGCN